MLAVRSIRNAQTSRLVRHGSIELSRYMSDAKKTSKTRVRKKKSDLPNTAVLASGGTAAPLPEWQGGLHGRTNLVKDVPEELSAIPPKKRKNKKEARSKNIEVLGDATEVNEISGPKTDLAMEIYQNLQRFPHCLLFTRVGQFYESYFHQASEIAKLLNIKLTSKQWGGKRVDMCGFPLANLEKHLKILIRDHQRCVALCEEFKQSHGRFERRVTRVLTPGTLIDEAFLNPYENNYVLSVSCPVGTTTTKDTATGLAWMDVSTGEFFSQQSTLGTLHDDIVRIAPKEIVLNEDLREIKDHPVRREVGEEPSIYVSFATHGKQEPQPATNLPGKSNTDDVTSSLGAPREYSPEETLAISQLTKFLAENLLEHMPAVLKPLQVATEGRMQIDAHTIKSLEIKVGIREGGTTGTLLSSINRTITTGGSRLLSRWICSPSTSVAEITARQDIVAFFVARPHLRSDLISLLRKIEDTARIVQKFLAGKGAPSHLRDIATAISSWEALRQRFVLERNMEAQERGRLIGWQRLDALLSNMVSLKELNEKISTAVDVTQEAEEVLEAEDETLDPMVATTTPKSPSLGVFKWTIKPSYSSDLSELHGRLEVLKKEKDELEMAYQAKFFANSLSLKASPHLGYHVHVKKRDASKLSTDPNFILLSESGSTKTFFNEVWFKLGTSLANISENILSMERAAFLELREAVTAQSINLRRNARIIDELDVTLAFAETAVEMNLVRPTVTEGNEYNVLNGRHPTVELGLLGAGRLFVPNSVDLNPSAQLHVITGPNMAGKSTLLRQTALIAILAQTGSFVPADSARIGVVDKLFSRVGAKDDLFRDRSTFMVEMLETAEILNRATSKSLVIMDEVGRGTSMNTALAIAFATIHHLYTHNRCRALFATHFHEIADMLNYNENTRKGDDSFQNVAFYCTDIDELENGAFTYSHKLKPGVNRDSHGLKVAKLAGMPSSALKLASVTLNHLQGHHSSSVPQRVDDLRLLGSTLASKDVRS
ncbi:putative MSH1-DNA mismatch repair protein, mitochondrial [Serendipita vermifera]|nr:putative MSH1-DNA mismatch repair protein, mitochondrial [Serendipita vermifera]